MRFAPLVAGLIGFAMLEGASLVPTGYIGSARIVARLQGRPNEAAVAWALSTRDPYLEPQTIRDFRTVTLGGAGPDVETLLEHLRKRLTLVRDGDDVVLSVQAPDRALATKAASYFGERVAFYTRRPLAAMSAPRIERLGLRVYVLRQKLGLTPFADSSSPPPALTADERARLATATATADRKLVDELTAADEELRYWTSPLKPPEAMTSASSGATVTAVRRFGTWPAHLVSFGVGAAFFGIALLLRRVLRGGAGRGAIALTFATASAPFVCANLAGAIAFEGRAVVRVEHHGPASGEWLATQFLQGKERFLGRSNFADLWQREAVEGTAGAPDLYRFAPPPDIGFRAHPAGVEIAITGSDPLTTKHDALALARRVASALESSGLVWYRQRAGLPQALRDAETRLRWHDEQLASGKLTPELEKIHRARRVEDQRQIASAREQIARLDAAPLPFDVVTVDPAATSAAVIAETPRARLAVKMSIAVSVIAALVVLLFARKEESRS